jgi:hypothetical protein
MASSARFTAILDACVLYPVLVRDVLLRLACAGLYHARWSATIENEWTRTAAIKEMRPSWKNPARTADELIKALELRGLPQTAAYLSKTSKLI